ncbi:MAG: DeoR/GlpR transcriptional regulator [Coprococcus sp.]|nr:DeoR/GlpR transcriptional regulator [Coprococcus sp.]
MIREERLNRLTEYARSKQYVSIDELISLLNVSKSTVHRDLAALEKLGVLVLSRGGALYNGSVNSAEPTYVEKNKSNTTEKDRIGKAAVSLIRPGGTAFIGAGTTARCMVPYLGGIPSFNLVTNDVLIAADCSDYTNVNVTVTGGQLRRNYYTLRGFAAENYISNMHIDVSFWGMDAVDPQNGCFIANADEVSLIQKVISISEKVVLLCDHSKFHNKAFMLVCPLDKISTIITDEDVAPSVLEMLRMQNLDIRLV